MSAEIEERLKKIPVIKQLVIVLHKVKLPGFSGYSLYDLLETYTIGIVQGTFSSRASSIAYSFFMAIFPFLLFILNVIPYISIENFQARFLTFIGDLLPAQTYEFFYPVIEDIALNPRSGLLSFTFLLTMFLTANGVNSIFSAFEYSIHVHINRGFIRQYLVSLMVAIFLAIITLLTVVAILYGEYIINFLKTDEFITNDTGWINVLQYLLFAIMIYIVISTLYHFGVKNEKDTSFFSIGAFVTALLFMLTTYFFGVYINNFSQYNQLYGSIGALIIMMVYIWINSNLLLLGFELNVSLRRLKKNKQS